MSTGSPSKHKLVLAVRLSYQKFRSIPTQESNGGNSILGKARVTP
jgi:hypothetical protein